MSEHSTTKESAAGAMAGGTATGYRVSLVPGALEVSARLASNEELEILVKVLEANNPVFDEPTLAVLSGDTVFYIANSQWAAIDEKGKLAADDKLRDPIVLKLKL